ncbi:MAG: DUF3784 domain-containing protein [Bacillota bacterium]|nr:DUF3784 domain-containing protein [Bacillota bacterium]
MWAYFIIGGVLIVIGILIHVFKWYFLISGYNTMSKEKKANVDTKSLGRLMGIFSYVNGGVFILLGILNILGVKHISTAAFICLGITSVFVLIKAQKYDGNLFDENGKLIKGRHFALRVGITSLALIFAAVSIFFAALPVKVTVSDKGIGIHGMYGDVYDFKSIKNVKLLDTLPNIELRTNGSAVGSKLKGHFKMAELGPVKLFVDTQKPPFIYFESGGKIIIFNVENADKTREIFDKIKTNTKEALY